MKILVLMWQHGFLYITTINLVWYVIWEVKKGENSSNVNQILMLNYICFCKIIRKKVNSGFFLPRKFTISVIMQIRCTHVLWKQWHNKHTYNKKWNHQTNLTKHRFDCFLLVFPKMKVWNLHRGRRGRDRMVVGFKNNLCNQCLSPLTLRVYISLRRGVLDTILCDKICHGPAEARWFSPGTLDSSTNKTNRYNVSEILLKVAITRILTLFTYSYIDWQILLMQYSWETIC